MQRNIFLLLFLTGSHCSIAQQDTIDSLTNLLGETAEQTVRSDLLRLIGWTYKFRDFDKAEQYLDSAHHLSEDLGDSIRLAIIEIDYALLFHNRFIHHLAKERLENGLAYLTGHNDQVALALKKYITAFNVYVTYNANSYTTTMLPPSHLAKTEKELEEATQIFEKKRMWLLLGDVYPLRNRIDEDHRKLKARMSYLFSMAEAYRNANFAEGLGIAYSHIGYTIHFAAFKTKSERRLFVPSFNPMDKSIFFLDDTTQEEAIVDRQLALKLDEKYYRKSLEISLATGNLYHRALMYNAIAYKCIERNKFDSAKLLYEKAYAIAWQMKDATALLKYAQTPPDIYTAMGDYKTASTYFYKYTFFLDSINKVNNIEAMAQIEKSLMVNKQKQEIEKLAAATLLQEAKNENQTIIIWSIISFFTLLLTLGGYAFRQRQKAYFQVKKNLEVTALLKKNIESQFVGLELQALQAQMNPHFVFNAINSIQNLILRDEKETAIHYLIEFSKLTRVTLENSKKETITLEEEITFLRHYLHLEQLRYPDKFDFQLIVNDSIDNTQYERIPPMFIQPFVENAIRHGIRPKEGKGLICVEFDIRDDSLVCVVEDNGVGRHAAGQNGASHQSMSTNITETRLELMSRKSAITKDSSITTIDLVDSNGHASGTRVEVLIPLE